MATPIGIQLKQRIATPSTATKTNHKPVKVTGILHFVENDRRRGGIMARHGAGINGVGMVIMPHNNNTFPFEDTGWHMISYTIGLESTYSLAWLVTNQGTLKAAIHDLRMQLVATPEGAAFFLSDDEIMAVAMINFALNGDGGLVGYYSQGNTGVNGAGIKVVPAGNSQIEIRQGWNLVALSENPDDNRSLVAQPVLDDQMIDKAINNLRDQLDMVQNPEQSEDLQQAVAS